jgi:hypothetical protein
MSWPGHREDRPVAPSERVQRCGARRDGEDAIVVIIVIEEPVHPHWVWRCGMGQRGHRRVNDSRHEPEDADELTSHAL